MNIELKSIKNGTILVSNSLYGPTFVQVVDMESGEWGASLDCHVIYSEHHEGIVSVASVGPVDKVGVGFKIASSAEIESMILYAEKAGVGS